MDCYCRIATRQQPSLTRSWHRCWSGNTDPPLRRCRLHTTPDLAPDTEPFLQRQQQCRRTRDSFIYHWPSNSQESSGESGHARWKGLLSCTGKKKRLGLIREEWMCKHSLLVTPCLNINLLSPFFKLFIILACGLKKLYIYIDSTFLKLLHWG